MEVRNKAILALTPTATHVDKEGYCVKASAGSVALLAADSDEPFGVVMEGAATTAKDSVAVCGGGLCVRVKLDATPGAVVMGSRLMSLSGGTFKLDPGSGARWIPAIALESGSAGELIEAVLVKPMYHSS